MKRCLKTCKELGVSCPIKECRYWIEYSRDNNCVFESVYQNGNMTLRQVADRLNISFVRVKQIQDDTIKKIGHLFNKESI